MAKRKKDEYWKQHENRVCRLFGGLRRTADFRNKLGGKNDCTGTDGFSVETKSWTKGFTFSVMMDDAVKAVNKKKNPLDIGLAVFHLRKRGVPWKKNSLVVMTLEEFESFYLGGNIDET